MTNIYDRPISEIRKKEVIKTIIDTTKTESLVRKILKVRNFHSGDENFAKLGFSLIVDKEFFVDEEKGDKTYYHYKGLGYSEGKAIAEGESNILFSLINPFFQENKILIKEKISEQIIEKAIKKLAESDKDCKFIVSNIHDVFEFWHMNRDIFSGTIKSENIERGTPHLEGFYKSIPVYWNRLLPRGIILFIDNNTLGEFVIKKDIDGDIKEIEEKEIEEIKKNLPELESANLKEKVRLYCEEIIKINILDKKSFVVLEFESQD